MFDIWDAIYPNGLQSGHDLIQEVHCEVDGVTFKQKPLIDCTQEHVVRELNAERESIMRDVQNSLAAIEIILLELTATIKAQK